MKLNYHDHFRPCSDVVFSIMAGKRYLFTELVSAVTYQKINLRGDPHSQASLREDDVLLNSIRFDAFGDATNNSMYAVDMQRTYKESRLENRIVYYSCRGISTQPVKKMAYEDLRPVNICFILTENENKQVVERIKFCNIDTYEVFSDLIEIRMVYVKTALMIKDKKSKLYLFARFYDISSQTEADKFVLDFGKSKLGRELIELYNKAVENVSHLKEIESSPYFTQRLNEAQLEEERKIAAKKAAKKAAKEAAKEEREKWQGVLSEKDALLSKKDAVLLEKDALIAELKKRLGEN